MDEAKANGSMDAETKDIRSMQGEDEAKITVDLVFNEDTNQITLMASIGTKSVSFLIDTGSNVSVIPMDVVESCDMSAFLEVSTGLEFKNLSIPHQPRILGKLRASITCQGVEIKPYFIVIEKGPTLIGLDVFQSYNCCLSLVPENPKLELVISSESISIGCNITIKCLILGRSSVGSFMALVDTGASRTFIPLSVALQLDLQIEEVTGLTISTIAGSARMIGIVRDVNLTLGDHEVVKDLIIEDGLCQVVIGLDVLLGFTILFSDRK